MAILPQPPQPPADPNRQAPAPEQPPVPPGAPPLMRGGEQISDEQVEIFLDRAYEVVYGGNTPDGQMNGPVVNMLKTGPDGGEMSDPPGALAKTAALVSTKVAADLESIDGAAVYAGMMELIGELATNAADEGIYDYSQQEIDAAAMKAGEHLYAQTQSLGLFPQEEMMRDVQQIKMDNETGVLDQDIAHAQVESQETPIL